MSYILSIASTYPTRPHFLVTASIDGYTRLTDLRHPHADSATASRVRVASPPLAFSAHADCVLSPEDSQGVRTVPLRRFFSASSVARVDGQVMALATSPVHASLLVAGSDGTVVAVNPLRRLVSPKGSQYWQQIWFKHEWVPNERLRPPGPEVEPEMSHPEATGGGDGRMDVDEGNIEPRRESDGQIGIANDNEAEVHPADEQPQPELRAGVARITEGYKLQPYSLVRGMKPQEPGTEFVNPRVKAQTKRKDKTKTQTQENTTGAQVAVAMDNRPSDPQETQQAPPTDGEILEQTGNQNSGVTEDQPMGAANDQASEPAEVAAPGAAENFDPALEDGNGAPAVAADDGAGLDERGAGGAEVPVDGQEAAGDADGEAGVEADSDEGPDPGSMNFLTIYEEEQAVTCLAWCPAVECGGWAAAGMGSGLVRVEDIAI